MTRYALCHPERVHHCKDLCKHCYHSAAHKRRYLDPEYAEKATERSRKWAVANPEHAYKLDANKNLIKKYGITIDQYNGLLEKQHGVCALCKESETIVTKKRICKLAVDHCHRTGRIRGLLCFKCNTSLSIIEKSPDMLESITKYLEVSNG